MTMDVKVLDGGFSTQLVTHVGEIIDGDPLWTSRFLYSNPDAVFQTHLDYLRAGAHIIETATYQASIPGYVKYLNKTEEESLGLIKTAVELAKKAVSVYKEEIKGKDVSNPEPMVAGSVGPYAAYLHDCSEYTGGSYANIESMDSIVEWHRPRFEALINEGVDLLAIETIPCAREAEALVGLLKQYPSTVCIIPMMINLIVLLNTNNGFCISFQIPKLGFLSHVKRMAKVLVMDPVSRKPL